MTPETGSSSTNSKLPRAAVSCFIAAYATGIGLWLCPPSLWRDNIVRHYEPLILWMGLWQDFAMFAPDPRKINLHIEALITYSDGSTVAYTFPRMEKLDLGTRILKERYRKYANDFLNWDKDKILWGDAARFVARSHFKPDKCPVTVELIRYWAEIPPPEIGVGKPLPPQDHKYSFFSKTFTADELQ
ncbi:MAG: hypothetical protein K2W95_04750 [Candidatus Obscuribacterales bacterium]|nr:hypothetical protein [Candidatus Obscuribacterales bacterium]